MMIFNYALDYLIHFFNKRVYYSHTFIILVYMIYVKKLTLLFVGT